MLQAVCSQAAISTVLFQTDAGVGEGKIVLASAGVRTAAPGWKMGLQPLCGTCKTQ